MDYFFDLDKVEMDDTGRAAQYAGLANYMMKSFNDKSLGVYSLAMEACSLDPKNADAHRIMGEFRAIIGMYEESKAHLERAIELEASPDKKDDLRKKLEEVQARIESGEISQPQMPAKDIPLAQIYADNARRIIKNYGDHEAAISMREYAVTLSPEDPQYRLDLAHSYFEAGLIRDSMGHAGAALSLSYDKIEYGLKHSMDSSKIDELRRVNHDASALFGITLSHNGEFQPSLKYLKQAGGYTLNPPAFHNALGRAMMMTEQPRELGIMNLRIAAEMEKERARREQYTEDLNRALAFPVQQKKPDAPEAPPTPPAPV